MTFRRMTVLASLAAALLLSGCTAAAPPTAQAPPEIALPPVGAAPDYQLGGAYEPTAEVEIVVRDRTAPPADGRYSICYVNGFQTQPGERALWPDDVLLHDESGAPLIDPGWPDEVLLDTSSAGQRDTIVEIVAPWIRGCADDGYSAVEFDNLDSFTRSGSALTAEDNTALAAALVAVAHDAGLAAGQKNAAEYSAALHEDAGFDFAVAEECLAYDECALYTSTYGDHVIAIEYPDTLSTPFTEACAEADAPASVVLRDRELVTPEDAGYVFALC